MHQIQGAASSLTNEVLPNRFFRHFQFCPASATRERSAVRLCAAGELSAREKRADVDWRTASRALTSGEAGLRARQPCDRRSHCWSHLLFPTSVGRAHRGWCSAPSSAVLDRRGKPQSILATVAQLRLQGTSNSLRRCRECLRPFPSVCKRRQRSFTSGRKFTS